MIKSAQSGLPGAKTGFFGGGLLFKSGIDFFDAVWAAKHYMYISSIIIYLNRQYWDGHIKYHQDREDGIDPTLGRKLYALFTQAGLTDIRVGVSALYKENFDWQTSVQNYVGPSRCH